MGRGEGWNIRKWKGKGNGCYMYVWDVGYGNEVIGWKGVNVGVGVIELKRGCLEEVS